MSQLAKAEDIIRSSFLKGFKPDPINLTVSQWADRFRKLTSRASSEPGPWRTSRTPYLKEILDSLSSNNPIDTVVFMKAAQIGATEAGNNWLGYIVDLCPGPTMMVQPTVDMIKRLAKQRLDPMFEETPCLADKVSEKKSRESSNTMFIKEFPGGMLLLAGANSPTGLRSAPMRNLFLDEVDAYPEDCGGEGSPIKLAEARTRTFKRNRKIFIVSTPTLKNHSQIETAFLETDQKYFFVPCPLCKHKQRLTFDRLKWKKGEPETVKYHCIKCEGAFDDGCKNTMLAQGEWTATAIAAHKKITGFHLNALYSPLGWFSWSDIAREWEEAQGNVQKLKYFVNTILGETWYEKGEAPDWERLYSRKEDYQRGEIPDEVMLLTAGVDVQNDRLEVEIVGWGQNMESWSIDYIQIHGNPAEREVWDKLEELKNKEYHSLDGRSLNILKMAIDSGNMTQIVYGWVYHQRDHRLMAIKGKSTGVVLVESPRTTDLKIRSDYVRNNGMKYYPVAVSLAKEELYSWLLLAQPKEGAYPRGFCHFPSNYEEEYFKQLTSEEKKRVVRNGIATYAWEKIRERNEALDLRVYARAAAFLLGVDKFSEEDWNTIRTSLINQREEAKNTTTRIVKDRKKSDFW